jgi:hypothetical protein
MQLVQDGAAPGLVVRGDIAHVLQQLVIDAAQRLPQSPHERLLGVGDLVEPRTHLLDEFNHLRHASAPAWFGRRRITLCRECRFPFGQKCGRPPHMHLERLDAPGAGYNGWSLG